MKKIFRIFIVVLVSFLFINMKKPTVFAVGSNYEYLPLGRNYFDPTNYTKTTIQDGVKINTTYPFKILQGRVYSIFSTYWQLTYIDNFKVKFYDYRMEEIGFDNNYNYIWDDDNGIIKLSYTSPLNASYMSVEFTIDDLGSREINWDSIDSSFYIFEGNIGIDQLKRMNTIMSYEGPNYNDLPASSGQIAFFETNVDNPITVDDIKANLSARDAKGVLINDKIKILSDNYTPNKNKLGEYKVIFEATDSSNNKSKLEVVVSIKDKTAPSITASGILVTSPVEELSINEILSQINVTDNYDTSITPAIKSNTYTPNHDKLGSYLVEVTATDSSGNTSSYAIVINVLDLDAPVITGPNSITKNLTETLPIERILTKYSAIDAIDGDVTNKIRVINDSYSDNAYTEGSHKIIIDVKDTAGNVQTLQINIVVTNVSVPVFFINNKVINIELKGSNDVNTLEISQIIDQMKVEKLILKDANVRVVADGYSEYKNAPGNYKIVLEANNEQLVVDVIVTSIPEEIDEIVNKNFFQIILNFFIMIWENIKKFFINLFT